MRLYVGSFVVSRERNNNIGAGLDWTDQIYLWKSEAGLSRRDISGKWVQYGPNTDCEMTRESLK